MREAGNWLESYLDYTREQESPEMFHFWSGVSVLAATLGRSVWLNRGFYTLYPNHYIIILAGSAVARKSVAVGVARDLLEKAGTAYIGVDRITNAGIIQDMSWQAKETGKGEIYVWADELKTFLSKEDARAGLLTTLTTLFGCPSIFRNKTVGRGLEVIPFPCVNVLAATTPPDLQELIPDTATGTGFTPRLHIVYQRTRRHRKATPQKNPDIERKLVADLQHIKRIDGEFRLSPEGDAWWLDYYDKSPDFGPSDELDSFYARKPDYMLKLAMIVSISRKDELVLEPTEMKIADDFINDLEKNLVGAYKFLGRTQSTQHFDRVMGQIQRRGGEATKSELLHDNWNRLNAAELSEVMRSLEEANKVAIEPRGRTMVWKEVKKK